MANLQMSSTAAAKNGEEPPTKKKKSLNEPISNLPLPDDLVVSCLARVSRFNYPFLSLVSKTFRSLIASPEIYRTRNILGCTENCLYVCLQFPPDPNPHWFVLNRKPDPITNHTSENGKGKKKKEKLSDNVLASIQIINSPTVEWSNLIAVGPYLYAINGPIADSLSFLDCRTHTWLEAPKMRLAHTDTWLDGSLYLPGCYQNPDSLNFVEVFNSKTQTWKPVAPGKRRFDIWNMEGKIYMFSGNTSTVSNPKNLTWEPVGWDSNLFSVCMIEKITYCYLYSGVFVWSGINVGAGWRRLEGLEGLPKFSKDSNVKLVDYGGKLMVLWDNDADASKHKEKKIYCAEISLERRNDEEIWGKVEWFDAVLTVPVSYKFMCAITATV